LDAAADKRRQRASAIEAAKARFYALFGAGVSPQTRGKKLEDCLNNLFAAYGVPVRRASHLVGDVGEGIVEQIDGVIELKGHLYSVELKWYREPVGKPEISEHLVRLMSRAEARGIIISVSSFTEPAEQTTREFPQHKVVILAHLKGDCSSQEELGRGSYYAP
jgi:restriction system protein